MRMIYWSCAAAGLAALGLWFTASYATNHPDSVAACCIKGVCHAGLSFFQGSIFNAGSESISDCNADNAVEIPLDPEPVADATIGLPLGNDRVGKGGGYYGGGEFVMLQEAMRTPQNSQRGRLPGKIIIDDGEEPPLATPERLTAEPNLDRFVQRIEAQWKSDDAAGGTNVTTAFWQTTTEYVRPMPYCDDDVPPVMLPADDPDLTPRKKEPPRIWFPFMPKGTEVGGDEKELSPNGNDCREDPSIPFQLPGCLNPKIRESKKVPMSGGEESSEPPEPQIKKSRNIEGPQKRRFFDPAKLQPFADPVKLDTMEFRPSDWGKRDVAVPPF